MRKADKCPCGHPGCRSWHVSPEAAVQGVGFTERQAKVVARALNALDEKIGREEKISSLEDDLRETYDIIAMCEGAELPKAAWKGAEALKALGLITLGSAHGPGKEFKRAEPIENDETFTLEEE